MSKSKTAIEQRRRFAASRSECVQKTLDSQRRFIDDPVQAHLLTCRAKLPQIDKTLATVRGDKEHYVKKAIEWLQRMATRYRQSLPRKVRKAEDATSANIAGQR